MFRVRRKVFYESSRSECMKMRKDKKWKM